MPVCGRCRGHMFKEELVKLSKNKVLILLAMLFMLVLILINYLYRKSSSSVYKQYTTISITPEVTKPQPSQERQPSTSSAFWFSNEEVWIEEPVNTYENRFFLLSTGKYQVLPTPMNKKTYKIPWTEDFTADSVSEPKISYNWSYGCVTIRSSGYSGFYIFSLPDGIKIDKGQQYSRCVEWIDNNRVIIAEKPYNTYNTSYYIFDARTKSKKVLSTFIQQ